MVRTWDRGKKSYRISGAVRPCRFAALPGIRRGSPPQGRAKARRLHLGSDEVKAAVWEAGDFAPPGVTLSRDRRARASEAR